MSETDKMKDKIELKNNRYKVVFHDGKKEVIHFYDEIKVVGQMVICYSGLFKEYLPISRIIRITTLSNQEIKFVRV